MIVSGNEAGYNQPGDSGDDVLFDSYAKTYGLVKGRRNFRITVKMPHGHQQGWAPAEIGLFIDQYLTGGVPLATVMAPTLREGRVCAGIETKTGLTAAALHYTTGTTPINKLEWETVPARLEGGQVVSPVMPEDATIWFLTVTDSRGAVVSSQLVFAEEPWGSG